MSLSLPPLPYALDALEPHISRRTLAAHHGHHHAAYVEKTRALVRNTPLESASLDEIVRSSARATPLFNSAAQAWNHAFYWQCMRPGGGGEAQGALAKLIKDQFGSRSAFSQQFVTCGGRPVRQRLGLASARRQSVANCRHLECRHTSRHDTSAAVDDRRVGARLLSGLPAPPPRLHHRIPGASRRLEFRQRKSHPGAERASACIVSAGICGRYQVWIDASLVENLALCTLAHRLGPDSAHSLYPLDAMYPNEARLQAVTENIVDVASGMLTLGLSTSMKEHRHEEDRLRSGFGRALDPRRVWWWLNPAIFER